MVKNVVSPTENKKEKKEVVLPVKATRGSKIQAALAVRHGLRKRQVQRFLNDGNTAYETWRKEGFKGAWWKRYFKNDAASD